MGRPALIDVIDVAAVRDRLLPLIRDQMVAQGIPGMAVALTDRRRTLWVHAEGYSDPSAGIPLTEDMLFETGSIGKSFTSIALLQEREKGKLDLDAPVTSYLPWFAAQSSHAPITIHHLLSHTSGLINAPDFSPDSRAQVWALRDTEVGWAPGDGYHYSNDGYKTLGLVLNAITGRPYADVIRSQILEPLGMSGTIPTITQDARERLAVGHWPRYDDRPARQGGPIVQSPWFETDTADGCLAVPVGDLATYLRMLLNRGEAPGGRILSEESFDLLVRPVIETDEPARWYGYGLFTRQEEGHTILGHGGGMPGFISTMLGDLDAGVGAIALVNSIANPHPVAEYALRLLRAAVKRRELPDPSLLADLASVDNAADYAGSYTCGEVSFTVRAEDGRLLLYWNGTQIPLERQEQVGDAFLLSHPDLALFPLRFGREDGRVVEAWHGGAWYPHERYAGPREFAVPDEWRPFTGHYRSFTPWLTNVRVVTRKGSLLLITPEGHEQSLEPAGEGRFKLGEVPGHVQFGPIVDGQAISARYLTTEYYRVDTP